MSARVELQGLDDLRRALRQLPDALATQAGDIVLTHATEAEQQIQRVYPKGRTGNLAGGVTIKTTRSAVATSALVRSGARHAHLFEFGTRTRHTNRGANRGRMPKAPAAQAMIPIAIRARRRMTLALIEMVRAQGFEVHE